MKNRTHHFPHRPTPEQLEQLANLRRHGGFGPGPFPGFPGGMGFGAGFGGPHGRGGRGRAGKGDIRAAIISLLQEGPSNGYGLIKAVAEKTEGAWRPSPGSVYPTLQQLVDEGLIAEHGEGRGTEYQLTDEGRAYATEHEEELTRAWQQNPAPSETSRELFEAVGRLMPVIAQFRHGATEEQQKAATAKVDELRKALYLVLAE